MERQKYSVYQGDVWLGPTVRVRHADTSFDFAGCTATSQMRKSAGSSTTPTNVTCTLDASTLGVLTVTLSLTGVQTAALPDMILLGDVVVTRSSPSFGPLTVLTYSLEVQDRVTA